MAGAARGATVPDAARNALEWLERLPPPVIAAPRGEAGQGYTGFVPNNDLDAALSGKNASNIEDAVASIRVGKTVRPILFDAAAPVLYCWRFDSDDERAAALCEAAGSLYQLGRGIDMAWADAAVLDAEEAQGRLSAHGGVIYRPSAGGGMGRDLLCPRPGTGRSLAARFDGMRTRFRSGGSNRKPVRVFRPAAEAASGERHIQRTLALPPFRAEERRRSIRIRPPAIERGGGARRRGPGPGGEEAMRRGAAAFR